MSLRGQTRGEYGNLASKDTCYDDLVRSLEERVAPPKQTELYWVQLKQRQQRATEIITELGQDVRRLTILSYTRAPNDVKKTLAMGQFIDALVIFEIRFEIKQGRPVDINNVLRHSVELEDFYQAERRHQGMVRPIINTQPAEAKKMEEMRKKIRDLKQQLESFSVRPTYRPQDRRLPRQPPSRFMQHDTISTRKPRNLNRLKCFN